MVHLTARCFWSRRRLARLPQEEQASVDVVSLLPYLDERGVRNFFCGAAATSWGRNKVASVAPSLLPFVHSKRMRRCLANLAATHPFAFDDTALACVDALKATMQTLLVRLLVSRVAAHDPLWAVPLFDALLPFLACPFARRVLASSCTVVPVFACRIAEQLLARFPACPHTHVVSVYAAKMYFPFTRSDLARLAAIPTSDTCCALGMLLYQESDPRVPALLLSDPVPFLALPAGQQLLSMATLDKYGARAELVQGLLPAGDLLVDALPGNAALLLLEACVSLYPAQFAETEAFSRLCAVLEEEDRSRVEASLTVFALLQTSAPGTLVRHVSLTRRLLSLFPSSEGVLRHDFFVTGMPFALSDALPLLPYLSCHAAARSHFLLAASTWSFDELDGSALLTAANAFQHETVRYAMYNVCLRAPSLSPFISLVHTYSAFPECETSLAAVSLFLPSCAYMLGWAFVQCLFVDTTPLKAKLIDLLATTTWRQQVFSMGGFERGSSVARLIALAEMDMHPTPVVALFLSGCVPAEEACMKALGAGDFVSCAVLLAISPIATGRLVTPLLAAEVGSVWARVCLSLCTAGGVSPFLMEEHVHCVYAQRVLLSLTKSWIFPLRLTEALLSCFAFPTVRMVLDRVMERESHLQLHSFHVDQLDMRSKVDRSLLCKAAPTVCIPADKAVACMSHLHCPLARRVVGEAACRTEVLDDIAAHGKLLFAYMGCNHARETVARLMRHPPARARLLPTLTDKEDNIAVALAEERQGAACCTICMDAPSTHAYYPCGHLAACGSCAHKWHTCPICKRGASPFHVFVP